MANRVFQDPSGSGFGGLTVFRDLLLMSVIARSALVLERTGDRRTFDATLLVILAVSTILGLIDDSKAVAALPAVSHFATVLFYRRGLPLRTAVLLALGGIVFATIVAPIVHGLRVLGLQDLDMTERIEFLATNASRLIDSPEEFDRLERLASDEMGGGYYNYFGEDGAGQMLLGRYASVQQIDPLIAEVKRQGVRGGDAIWPGLARQLPSFIYKDKPQYSDAYYTLVHYHLVDPAGGKFPTLPLAGQAYAAYGLLGLLTLPFLTFTGFLLILKKLGWQLYRNVYAIFFFCSFVVVYASQGDFAQYAGASVRYFPELAIVFWLVKQGYRVRLRRRSRRYLFGPEQLRSVEMIAASAST